MTDTLRDLLREAVADIEMPDAAQVAWVAGGRARRRRVVSAVAGVAAVALVVGGVVWAVDQRDSRHSAQPVHEPSPSVSSTPTNRADGQYAGTPVWWAPSVAREASLPSYPDGPLPATVDLSVPVSPLAFDPVTRAVAAFALSGDSGRPDSVEVLGSDGVLRQVSLGPAPHAPAPVQPMLDPEGNLRIRVGSSMLSPSGEYLMFPQEGSIRLLRLADQQWSTIATGAAPTWDATWADSHGDRIVLWDTARPDATPPVYDVDGSRADSTPRRTDFLSPRFGGDMYGLPRRSPDGSLAQSYGAGLDVPQPPSLHLSRGQSDSIGVASAPDAMLVLPQETARQKQCCQVASWLNGSTLLYESRSSDGLRLLAWQVGTGRFWQVSRVVGWRLGQVSLVSSYADLGG